MSARKPVSFRGQSGQAAAELGLVLPMILLLIMGTLAMGHLLYAKMVVTMASNEAARLGSQLYADPTVPGWEAESKVRDTAIGVLSHGLSGNDNQVTVQNDGQNVTVVVIYHYHLFVPFVAEIFNNRSVVDVTYQATYRLEG